MKVLEVSSIAFLFALVSASEKPSKYYDTLFRECRAEHKYALDKFKWSLLLMDINLGCLTICVLKKTNEYKNKQIDKEAVIWGMIEVYGEEIMNKDVQQRVESCVDQGNLAESACKKGLVYMDCIVSEFVNRTGNPWE